MIDSLRQMDPLVEYLSKESALTNIQMDTLLCEEIGRASGLTLVERVKRRDGVVVKRGAYMRSLKQGKENIKRAVFTLLLAQYLGLIDEGTIEGLTRAGDLLSSIKTKTLSEERISEITETLQGIAWGLVVSHGRSRSHIYDVAQG